MNHIGCRLKEVLRMKGINATTLAQDLKIGKGHISNIITGRIQTPKKHLHAIAEYLQISPAWLLTGEGNPEAGINGLTSRLPVYKIQGDNQELIGIYKLSGMIFTNHHYGLIGAPAFPHDMMIVLDPEAQGDGYYLIRDKQTLLLAQRIDHITHLDWQYLSLKTPTESFVIGKVEAIINKEIFNYEKA
jgi:transcriptional regulator with XRE-family HTH domain